MSSTMWPGSTRGVTIVLLVNKGVMTRSVSSVCDIPINVQESRWLSSPSSPSSSSSPFSPCKSSITIYGLHYDEMLELPRNEGMDEVEDEKQEDHVMRTAWSFS
jgi:hypothetical protein